MKTFFLLFGKLSYMELKQNTSNKFSLKKSKQVVVKNKNKPLLDVCVCGLKHTLHV
jgi:hypothetical protein